MSSKTIKGSIANELMYGDETSAEILAKEFDDERRWFIDYRVVFKIRGELGFYAITVSEPKTEEGEFETYDSQADVPVKLVVPKVVQTVIYEEVNEDG